MRLFAIDNDNNITAFPAAEQIPEGQEHFASEKELAKLAANWPADRLVQIWNGFAGVTPFDDLKPVKKFTDRKSAVARDLEGHPDDWTPRPERPPPRQGGRRCAEEDQGDQGCQGQGRPRPRRARAARRPSCWNCCAARTARRWPRSPRPRTGRTTASGASSAEPSPRRWASRSRAPRTRTASAATSWPSRTCLQATPPATRLAASCFRRDYSLAFRTDRSDESSCKEMTDGTHQEARPDRRHSRICAPARARHRAWPRDADRRGRGRPLRTGRRRGASINEAQRDRRRATSAAAMRSIEARRERWPLPGPATRVWAAAESTATTAWRTRSTHL